MTWRSVYWDRPTGCEMDESTRQELLDELCPHLRPLIARVMDCECGCEVLDFFRQRSLTWLEASDIAYHLRQSPAYVIEALNQLAEVGILERHTVLSRWTFYGLARNAGILQALEQFWSWRDDYHARLERAEDALKLRAPKAYSAPSL